jgi:hypothetical protein
MDLFQNYLSSQQMLILPKSDFENDVWDDEADASFMYSLAHDFQNEELETALSPEEYKELQAVTWASPLFEELCRSETCLDDLSIGNSKDGTYKNTYTAVRKLNMFWATHNFDVATEPNLFQLRSDFSRFIDGFSAICAMTHTQRCILLAHFVVKVVSKDSSQPYIRGTTKRVYLNSIMRACKMYEVQMGLTRCYGADWSWAKDPEYRQLRAALKRVTIDSEIKMDPSAKTTKADFMSEEQLHVLLDYVWNEAEKAESYSIKLMHFIHYFILSLLLFSCLRGRDEIAMCTADEITAIDENTLLFQMKRDYKSHKLNAQMNVIHKPSRLLLGKKLVQIYEVLTNKRKPGKHVHRLFLKPLPSAHSNSQYIWSDVPIGKSMVGETVQFYVKQLVLFHPLFRDGLHFTNTSLRKYHCNRLSDAGAPLIVQQASLAQNTRAYARGDNDMATKLKVANIVAGNVRSWHEHTTHSESNMPYPKKTKVYCHEVQDENKPPSSVSTSNVDGFLKINITKGDSNFNLEYKL